MEVAAWEGGPRRLLFAAHGRPIPQGTLKSARRRNSNKTNTWHENEETLIPWRQTVAVAAREALPGPPLAGPLEVEITFTMPKPKSLPKGKPAWPATRPDLDKLIRAVLDALTDSGAWKDDGQVVRIVAEETYGHDRSLDRPGVLVVVKELDT